MLLPHLKSLLWTRSSWLQLKKVLTRERFWMRFKLAESHIEWSELQKLCKLHKLQKLPTTQGWNRSIHKGWFGKGALIILYIFYIQLWSWLTKHSTAETPSLIFASLGSNKWTPDLERRGGNKGCTAVTPAGQQLLRLYRGLDICGPSLVPWWACVSLLNARNEECSSFFSA